MAPSSYNWTGEGLVRVLGWGIDDFDISIKEADEPALRRALEILSAPDTLRTPDWAIERAKYGCRVIQRRLSPCGDDCPCMCGDTQKDHTGHEQPFHPFVCIHSPPKE